MGDAPATPSTPPAPAPAAPAGETIIQRSGGVNSGHVIATAALSGDLTPILMWVTHWPLQPLDTGTAGAISALIIAIIGGGGFAIFRKSGGHRSTDNGATP